MKDFHRLARLGREHDRLPWGGRMFGKGTDREGVEIVDPRDAFTASLIRDGSIALIDEPPADEPARAPEAFVADQPHE